MSCLPLRSILQAACDKLMDSAISGGPQGKAVQAATQPEKLVQGIKKGVDEMVKKAGETKEQCVERMTKAGLDTSACDKQFEATKSSGAAKVAEATEAAAAMDTPKPAPAAAAPADAEQGEGEAASDGDGSAVKPQGAAAASSAQKFLR